MFLRFKCNLIDLSPTVQRCQAHNFLGPVPTTPEEFEDGALFLRLGLPSTLLRNCPPKTKLFENALEFENGALRFSVDGKHFENGAFRKRWRHDNHVICLPESSSNTNPKWRPVLISPRGFNLNLAMLKLTCALKRFCRPWLLRFQISSQ